MDTALAVEPSFILQVQWEDLELKTLRQTYLCRCKIKLHVALSSLKTLSGHRPQGSGTTAGKAQRAIDLKLSLGQKEK